MEWYSDTIDQSQYYRLLPINLVSCEVFLSIPQLSLSFFDPSPNFFEMHCRPQTKNNKNNKKKTIKNMIYNIECIVFLLSICQKEWSKSNNLLESGLQEAEQEKSLLFLEFMNGLYQPMMTSS